MASAQEAFQRFVEWQQSRTLLQLRVIEKGKPPDVLMVQITAVDAQASQVSFLPAGSRFPRAIDFSDAAFQIGKRMLEAQTPTGDYLTLIDQSDGSSASVGSA